MEWSSLALTFFVSFARHPLISLGVRCKKNYLLGHIIDEKLIKIKRNYVSHSIVHTHCFGLIEETASAIFCNCFPPLIIFLYQGVHYDKILFNFYISY